MLSVADAHVLVSQHLGDTPRATHTRFVAGLMRKLAEHFSEDGVLWEVVGLCHDLDFFETAADRTQHGLLAASRLGDQLPDVARQAIAAHDHHTGMRADTLLADMLKVADAAAIIDQRFGRQVWGGLDPLDPFASLDRRLGERAYLGNILKTHMGKHALPFGRIADFVAAAPPQ